MYFDEDDDVAIGLNPELLHVIQQKMYYITEGTDEDLAELAASSGFKSVPTHTEDGIPIRKIYVSNLPPKTNRTQLFEVFAQYGFIKSCWLRMGEKGTPTYAFVTYSDPADAHKALTAPSYEKNLRGRNLRTSPADSWHQPAEDSEGKVLWKQKNQVKNETGKMSNSSEPCNSAGECSSSSAPEAGTSKQETEPQAQTEEGLDEEPHYDIMDVLNRDCIHHILEYIPVRDLIRAERVNKRWKAMLQEYFSCIRTFKTSWWQHERGALTTAVLRHVLARFASLQRLHIDHHVSALNDRTAHVVGKFSPSLEELKGASWTGAYNRFIRRLDAERSQPPAIRYAVEHTSQVVADCCPALKELQVVGMHTKNWNPLVYGCKNLKILTFISCNKLADANLVQIIKGESNIERLTVANNSRVTGLFLTGANPPRLNSLAFHNCFSLQGTVLAAAIKSLPHLTVLKLDVGPNSLWKVVPMILKQLPKLEELSLSEYMASDSSFTPTHDTQPLHAAFATLTELRILNLSRNIYINDEVLKTIAETSKKLTDLDVSCCNYKRGTANEGVGDEGVKAICKACSELSHVNVSYLAALTDAGLGALARCARLRSLTARGMPGVTAAPLAKCVAACHALEELDVCGCDAVSESLVSAASAALAARPRPLALRLAATAAALADRLLVEDVPRHPLLGVDVLDDRSNPNLRPDFVDNVYEDASDDSLDDLYDPYFHHGDDFLDSDDEDFFDVVVDSDDFEYEIEWGLNARDIMLL